MDGVNRSLDTTEEIKIWKTKLKKFLQLQQRDQKQGEKVRRPTEQRQDKYTSNCISRRRQQRTYEREIVKDIMSKSFSRIDKEFQFSDSGVQPSNINKKKLIFRHIKVELKSNKDMMTLKTAREKRNINQTDRRLLSHIKSQKTMGVISSKC